MPAVPRRSYRLVIWLCCACYYVSLPLILLTVLAGGYAYSLRIERLGVAPYGMYMLMALFSGVTIWAIVASLMARPDAFEDLPQEMRKRLSRGEQTGE